MSPTEKLYHYRARVERVIDGDTFVALIDTGFSGFVRRTVRVLGMNAPEPHGETKKAGVGATNVLRLTVAIYPDVILRTEKPDSFGRVLADVYLRDGTSLAEIMIAQGYAAPAEGKRK